MDKITAATEPIPVTEPMSVTEPIPPIDELDRWMGMSYDEILSQPIEDWCQLNCQHQDSRTLRTIRRRITAAALCRFGEYNLF
jgi:hypothetical protein